MALRIEPVRDGAFDGPVTAHDVFDGETPRRRYLREDDAKAFILTETARKPVATIPDPDLDAISDEDLCEAVNAIVSSMIRRACPEHGEEDKSLVREAMLIKQMRMRFESASEVRDAKAEKLSLLAEGADLTTFARFCLSKPDLQYAVYVDNGKFSMWQGGGYDRDPEYDDFVALVRRHGWEGDIRLTP